MSVIKQILNDKNSRLPTPPAVAIRILKEINKTEPSFANLAKFITSDQALTIRVLRIANSPIMSPIAPVESVNKALTRMGLTLVTNIALSFALVANLHQTTKDAFDFDYFWKRAITAAVSANIISNTIKHPNDNIFITALLQDIGILSAYKCIPEYQKLFNAGKSGSDAEAQCNFSHSELGSALLSKWGLPENITLPILFHHQPERAPKKISRCANIINLSNKLSAIFNNKTEPEKLKEFHAELNLHYIISEQQFNTLIEEISTNSMDVLALLEIPNGQLRSSTQILQEANEALCSLNLSNSQLLNQYQQEKEQARKTSAELLSANAELSRLAFQDSLTGLYNLRYFYDYIDRELHRSSRYDSFFAFLMFDIDDFKNVNDTYGHQAGDKLLQEIAAIALQTMRNTDLVARYGGEEFAVIMPETCLTSAMKMAERLRENIANLSVGWKEHEITVTTSIGVSFSRIDAIHLGRSQIIANADEALYKAKNSGKNRVCSYE